MKNKMTVKLGALALLAALAAGAKAQVVDVRDGEASGLEAKFKDSQGDAGQKPMTSFDGSKQSTSDAVIVKKKKAAAAGAEACGDGGAYSKVEKSYEFDSKKGKLAESVPGSKLKVKLEWKKPQGHWKCLKDAKVTIEKKESVFADAELIEEIRALRAQVDKLTMALELDGAGQAKENAKAKIKIGKPGKYAKVVIDAKGEAEVSSAHDDGGEPGEFYSNAAPAAPN